MSDQDSLFEAMAILVKQYRDLESRIAVLESAHVDHHARLAAQSMLIEQLRRPANIPSLHPVWRKEAA